MPKFDGRGPAWGGGPGAGWGRGPCGCDYGRGFGGQFFGRQYLDAKEEAELLKEEADVLEKDLAVIKKRLAQVKGK